MWSVLKQYIHVWSKFILTTCNVMDKLLHVQTMSTLTLCNSIHIVNYIRLHFNLKFNLKLHNSTHSWSYSNYVKCEGLSNDFLLIDYVTHELHSGSAISLLYSKTMSRLTPLIVINSKHICNSNRQCSRFYLQELWQVFICHYLLCPTTLNTCTKPILIRL